MLLRAPSCNTTPLAERFKPSINASTSSNNSVNTTRGVDTTLKEKGPGH